MSKETTGRYGVLGDVGRCIPAPDYPKPVVRIRSSRMKEVTLQNAIADTGCTITEILFYNLDRPSGLVHLIHGPDDSPNEAAHILKKMGYKTQISERCK